MKNTCSFYCYLLSSLPLCLCITPVYCLVINLACKISVEESIFIMVCQHKPRRSDCPCSWQASLSSKGPIMYLSEMALHHHKHLLPFLFKCWTAFSPRSCSLISPQHLGTIQLIIQGSICCFARCSPAGLISDASGDGKYLPPCSGMISAISETLK